MMENKYYDWYMRLDQDKREFIKEFIPMWLNAIIETRPGEDVVVSVGEYKFELHVDVLEAPNE